MAAKNENQLPLIQAGVLELHGDLFFASLEASDMVETLPIIHNYALTYALGLCTEQTGRKSPLYWDIERRKQRPMYREDFAFLVERDIYVTPAKVQGVPNTHIRQFASRIDEYLNSARRIDSVLFWESNPKKRTEQNLSSIFPMHGYMKVIAPETRFLFFVYGDTSGLLPKRFYIRLGKFDTKTEVRLKDCSVSPVLGERQSTHPLNITDSPNIVPMDWRFMRPTYIAEVARLPQAVEVTFNDPWTDKAQKVYLPQSPRYRFGEVTRDAGSDNASRPSKAKRSRR